MIVVIPEVMDAGAVDWLRERFKVVYDPQLVEQPPHMLDALREATGIIVKDRTQVDRTLLASAPGLRVVGRLGVGLDNIDLTACKERGIAVFPAIGANARSVAEYVLCTALMLLRPGAYTSTVQVAAGDWPQKIVRGGREIDGKTLGILGLGAIGKTVARLATVFGMRVLAWAPTKLPTDSAFAETGAVSVELEELLSASDIVTVHLPLTGETRNLLDRKRVFSMKRGAIFINTARGGIVDDRALVQALREPGRLAGAAVDVYEQEPLPAGSIYADVPNLLLSPHIAGGTIESTERRGTVVAQKVAAYLKATV